MTVILKLGKYIVPYLDVAVTVTAHCTVRLSAAVLFSTVIVDLGTGTAWTSPMLPEVILLAEAEDLYGRNTNLISPDVKGLIILQVNRGIESFRV